MVLPAVPPKAADKDLGTGLRERKRQRTRQAILDAAWVLFTRDGVAGTPIRSIAELAEVSDVTLYSYFKSRSQLIEELMSRHSGMDRVVAALNERPASEGPVEALRAIQRRQAELSAAEFKRQIKILRMINDDPVMRGAYRNSLTHYNEILVRTLLPRAQAVGMSERNLTLLCMAFHGMVDGLSDSADALASPQAWADATDEALALLADGWGR
ncbi:TetR/AcrR family transcriptional regulator [Streptomyces violaceusniger]|uniref:TetR/AcrR family transcriptional regulator n=1 Tax=Streptomyces violaceusniger TaxID=68280 RepID=UPI00341E4FF0